MKGIKGFQAKQNNPAWKGGPVERTCLNCGVSFWAVLAKVPGQLYSDRTRAKSIYCSRECNTESQKRSNAQVMCEFCGEAFYVIPAKTKTSRFCSILCKANSQKKSPEDIKANRKVRISKRRSRLNAAKGSFTSDEWKLLK